MLNISILTTSLALFAPTFAAPSSDPLPAMVTGASLAIDDVDVTVTNLGDGHYESELRAAGTVTVNDVTVNTWLVLDCEADSSAQSLQCTGGIRLGTSDAPIGLQYLDGEAHYALGEDFVQTHSKIWELWFTELLIDGVPPADENGNRIIYGWEWSGAIIIGGRILWVESDWLWIIDGVIMNPPNW